MRLAPEFNKWFISHASSILRPEEHWGRPAAAFYFLLGCSVAHMISNDFPILTLSILYVSFCDPVASLSGILIPSPMILKGKSISGCVGGIIAGIL